mgnify:FL=1
MSDKPKMFMRSTKTGKFIKDNVERIRAGEKCPIWELTDDPHQATNDPGYVAGEDHTMTMIITLKKEQGEGSFECCGEEILSVEKGDADN